MDDLTNQFIGGYHFQWRIAQGGMATVYVGQRLDDPDAPQVALKVLHPRLAVNPVIYKRFRREAELGQRLRHPNIVQVFEFMEASGYVFIVMQYMPGGSLAERLMEVGALPWPTALQIIRQVGEALAYAHAQGVVHRDVKPSNILFDEFGDAYLADFGVAHDEDASTLTASGMQPGTMAYMSPEQIQGHQVDARSDQFSLAVVLYHTLTGTIPFEGTTTAALTYQIVHKAHKHLPRRDDIPKAAQKVLDKALAKKPEDRYPDVLSFVDALASLSQPAKREKGRALPVAAILLLLLALAGGAYVFMSDQTPTIAFQTITEALPGASQPTATPIPSPTAPATATATATFTPTPTPQPTDTPTPPASVSSSAITPSPVGPIILANTQGETPQPSETTREAPPTPTLIPTHTPTPTRQPTPTPKPKPTLSQPTPTIASEFNIGLIAPAPYTEGDKFELIWQGYNIPSGLAYEPVIWRTGSQEDLLRYGMSPTGVVQEGRIIVDFRVLEGRAPLHLTPGHEYYWGVCVVRTNPYQRLYCSEGRPFRYQTETGGGGGNVCPPDC